MKIPSQRKPVSIPSFRITLSEWNGSNCHKRIQLNNRSTKKIESAKAFSLSGNEEIEVMCSNCMALVNQCINGRIITHTANVFCK